MNGLRRRPLLNPAEKATSMLGAAWASYYTYKDDKGTMEDLHLTADYVCTDEFENYVKHREVFPNEQQA